MARSLDSGFQPFRLKEVRFDILWWFFGSSVRVRLSERWWGSEPGERLKQDTGQSSCVVFKRGILGCVGQSEPQRICPQMKRTRVNLKVCLDTRGVLGTPIWSLQLRVGFVFRGFLGTRPLHLCLVSESCLRQLAFQLSLSEGYPSLVFPISSINNMYIHVYITLFCKKGTKTQRLNPLRIPWSAQGTARFVRNPHVLPFCQHHAACASRTARHARKHLIKHVFHSSRVWCVFRFSPCFVLVYIAPADLDFLMAWFPPILWFSREANRTTLFVVVGGGLKEDTPQTASLQRPGIRER